MSKGKDRYIQLRDEQLTPALTREYSKQHRIVFEAGVQYALDRMLTRLGKMTVGPMEIEHMTAADILEQVKSRGPL